MVIKDMKYMILMFFGLFANHSCLDSSIQNPCDILHQNDVLYWELIIEKEFSDDWITIWRFSNNGDYHQFFYNKDNQEIELIYHKDNVEANKFYCKNNDTLVLNKSPFPIIEANKKVVLLKNIYGDDYHNSDTILLKKLSIKSEITNYHSFLIKVDSILESRR